MLSSMSQRPYLIYIHRADNPIIKYFININNNINKRLNSVMSFSFFAFRQLGKFRLYPIHKIELI